MKEATVDSKRIFHVEDIRKDFPILNSTAYGKPLVYLDNAATSQKPQCVIDALTDFYSHTNANIHRGVHYLSQKASQEFDEVRIKVKEFIHARSEREIIFVRGTTEAVNLVATTWGRTNLNAGDIVLVTAMEHHSNIVPWQLVAAEKRADVVPIPMDDRGELDMKAYAELLQGRVKFVSIVHTSNALGTVNPVKEMIRLAHALDIPVMVDAAQAVVHEPLDVQELDCDFLAFSGHKMLGPTGIGVLYGKENILEELPPYQGGGEMIASVSFERTTFNEIPFRFEAGTPNIADVVALGAAIDYLHRMDRAAAWNWEQELLAYATSRMLEIDGLRIIGTASHKAAVISFIIPGINALDLGMFLDTCGVAVRTGHHCAEPVMHHFGIPGTLRASFMFYNTKQEVDILVESIRKGLKLLAV